MGSHQVYMEAGELLVPGILKLPGWSDSWTDRWRVGMEPQPLMDRCGPLVKCIHFAADPVPSISYLGFHALVNRVRSVEDLTL